MATEKQMIPFAAAKEYVEANYPNDPLLRTVAGSLLEALLKVEAVPVKNGRLYNVHEVAEILADAFGDPCACNFNGIDEWLPEKCELQSACPNTVGVACWEQYLKYRDEGADNVD